LCGRPPPQVAATLPKKRARGPHRIEPITVEPKKAKKTARAPAGGGLPHKTVATDSRAAPSAAAPSTGPAAAASASATSAGTPPTSASAPTASATPAPSALPEELPSEATPLTEEEQRHQAEASIDADGVRFVVKSHLPQVHACYERAFKESSPGGRVEIAFAIQPSGRAARVRTESNSTESESLPKCLEARIRDWEFPRPVGGEYELIYPFVFSPGS
jgi:hypothetical protein